jgi:V/A-type H+-transporting ATPase subunit D
MPQGDIAPTKSNYLQIQESLERAREGYNLLDQKRQILVMELMNRVEAARRIKRDTLKAMQEAYGALEEASITHGSDLLARLAARVTIRHKVRVSSRSMMGIDIPEINYEAEPVKPQFSLSDWGSGADQVMVKFRKALEFVARLAEVENAVFRLAREIKKTQRRVRALEKTFIPDYEDKLAYISASLEEREREDLVIMKKAKQKRQARQDLK